MLYIKKEHYAFYFEVWNNIMLCFYHNTKENKIYMEVHALIWAYQFWHFEVIKYLADV